MPENIKQDCDILRAAGVRSACDAQRFARVALWYWFREKSEEWYCAGWDPYTLTRAMEMHARCDLPRWICDALQWAGWPDENLSWEGVGSFDKCPDVQP